MNPKTRRIIGWVLTAILALLLISSAIMKLIGTEEVLKGTTALGLSKSEVTIIGLVELLSALLFIFPRTGVLGTLLLAAYLGGAIATHLEHQLPIMVPVIIESVLCITAAIRFPELTRRLSGNATV
jgi:sorbitol-specific phosphotransferase system component IIC